LVDYYQHLLIKALKVKTAGFCRTFVPLYQSTQRHISEDRSRIIYRFENLSF